MKFKTFIIAIIFLGVLGAGFYFRVQIFNFYNNFEKNIQNFQQSDIGSLLSQTGKEILTPPPLNVGGDDNKAILLKSKIIEETNLQREINGGLPVLSENFLLSKMAEIKANDMFLNQYFEHVSPLGLGASDLAKNQGYEYIMVGENLILGNFNSEKEMVQSWMDSPGHRANVLNNRFTEIGVSVVRGTYKGESVWIGVQEFGLPLSACNQLDESFKNQIDFQKNQLEQFILSIDQKKAEINNTNPKSAHYSQLVDDYNRLVENYNSLAEQTKQNILQYNLQVSDFNNCVLNK
jgi:uncharacterized protein YkwD